MKKRNKIILSFSLLLAVTGIAIGTVYLLNNNETVESNKTFSIEENSFKPTKEFFSFGEKASFTFKIKSNFNYELIFVKINDQIYENNYFTCSNDLVTLNTNFKLSSPKKYFSITEIKYKNTKTDEKLIYTTHSCSTTVYAKEGEEDSGEIKDVSITPSFSKCTLNDWNAYKSNFYLNIEIKKEGNVSLPKQNSFTINDKLYNSELINSSITDEDTLIYKVSEIVNDLNIDNEGIISFKLTKINYLINNNSYEKKLNLETSLNIIQQNSLIINNSTIKNQNDLDGYQKIINQYDDRLDIVIDITNSQNYNFINATLHTNYLKKFVINESDFLKKSYNDLTRLETNICLSSLVPTLLNKPFELEIITATLKYQDPANPNKIVEIEAFFNYKTCVYTKFISDANELANIDNCEGSYIITKDINLDNIDSSLINENRNFINTLKCYLNGNRKKISRPNFSTYGALIKTIESSGYICDLEYEGICELIGKTEILNDGTPENKFTDVQYKEERNYATTSFLAGYNYGTIEKIKCSGTIITSNSYQEKHPYNFDGIVGINDGTLKNIDINYDKILLRHDGLNTKIIDFKEFSFICYSNNGQIQNIFVHDGIINSINGYKYFNEPEYSNNFALDYYKNTSYYYISKYSTGLISNICFRFEFWNQTGFELNLKYCEFFAYPLNINTIDINGVKTADIKNYFIDGYVEDTKIDERYFSDIYYIKEQNWDGTALYDKYGKNVVEKLPSYHIYKGIEYYRIQELISDYGISFESFKLNESPEFYYIDSFKPVKNKDGTNRNLEGVKYFYNSKYNANPNQVEGSIFEEDAFNILFKDAKYKDLSIWEYQTIDNNRRFLFAL